jgi:TPR repeat protein
MCRPGRRSGQAVLLALVAGLALLEGCAVQRMVVVAQADDEYRTALQLLVADPPDQEAALEHLRRAAIWNHAGAQKQLGRVYASSGPQSDLVRGYLWLYLASRTDVEAEREMSYLGRMMTVDQIDRARALAASYVPGRAPDESLAPVPGEEAGGTASSDQDG